MTYVHFVAARGRFETVLGELCQMSQQKRIRRESRRISCPHCGWAATIRTSEAITALTRQTTYSCTNWECGHNFKSLEEIVVSLTPSSTPNPSVHLPLSSHVRRGLLKRQLDCGHIATHTPVNTSPSTLDLFDSD